MSDIHPDVFASEWLQARSTGHFPQFERYFEPTATFEGEPLETWLGHTSAPTLEFVQVMNGPSGLSVHYRASDGTERVDGFMTGSGGLIAKGWIRR